jgi:UDP-N-acetylmuramate--alanine ligase
VTSSPAARAPFNTLTPGARIHMVGVAGAGMNALAAVLLARGFALSGSDQQESAPVSRLVGQGMAFQHGHHASAVAGASLVIISAAVQETNVELVAARAAAIPVVKRAAALGWLLSEKRVIAVAGTHGKTTTSAMLAVILERARFDPTYVVGGEVLDLGGSARFGSGAWAVVEADEYDRSFLQLQPTIALITNVEPDHLEYFGSAEAMYEAFRQFVGQILPDGTLVLNQDDRGAAAVAALAGVSVVRCGMAGENASWRATNIVEGGDGAMFQCSWPDGQQSVRLRVPGRHNVSNALQAMAAASVAGVQPGMAARALAEFHGAGRRFQVVGEVAGVLVIDDYAHHPTEIRATLAAARARYAGRRLVVVFQPHTFSRTKLLFDDFAGAFDAADLLLVTDIYGARESDTLGIDSGQLAEAIAERLGPARLLPVCRLDDAATLVSHHLKRGDVVLTLGAGTITELGPRLIAGLTTGTPNGPA